MTTLLTGATGFIGRKLIEHLDNPITVSRNPGHTSGSARTIQCDLSKDTFRLDEDDKVDCVVNLLGEPVDGRWTDDKKKRIRDSRVLGTRNLIQSLIESDSVPAVFVGGSAIGYYGETGDELLTESSSAGDDFLAQVCAEWEKEAQAIAKRGSRVVLLRTGLVFGDGGRALEKILMPFRFGLGGKLGSGRQWMSWIHIDDIVQLILELARNENYSGPVNAVAPEPVKNIEFTKTLGRIMRRPSLFPVPRIALRLMVGEFANNVLMSQRVQPAVAIQNEFKFQYADVGSALQQIVTKS